MPVTTLLLSLVTARKLRFVESLCVLAVTWLCINSWFSESLLNEILNPSIKMETALLKCLY